MRFSDYYNDWKYEWLCVLDMRCGEGDGLHSGRCTEMNAEREQMLWKKERERRAEIYEAWGIVRE